MEKQSAASCPVLGGKKMVLSGHNFLQDSKVIFVEKAPGTSLTSGPGRAGRFGRREGQFLEAEPGRSLGLRVLGSGSKPSGSAVLPGLPPLAARGP